MSPLPPKSPRRRGGATPAPPEVAPLAAFEVHDGVLVVRPAGEFAEYVEDLMQEVDRRVAAEPRSVVLNFSGITYISSRGLGLVFDLYKRLNKAGLKLCLAEPSENVADVFDVAGLTEILTLYATEAEALAAAGAA